jgi:hypothetical protein
MKKYYHYENFDKIGNDCKSWARKAEELLIAASFLEDAYTEAVQEMSSQGSGLVSDGYFCYFPKYLLQAVAIENFLKAIFVQKAPLCKDGKYIGLKTHKLINWADLVDLKLDKNEKELLERLTFVIETIGRYPIPLKKNFFIREINIEGVNMQGVQPIFYSKQTDTLVLDELLRKLKKLIKGKYTFFE